MMALIKKNFNFAFVSYFEKFSPRRIITEFSQGTLYRLQKHKQSKYVWTGQHKVWAKCIRKEVRDNQTHMGRC